MELAFAKFATACNHFTTKYTPPVSGIPNAVGIWNPESLLGI